MSEENARASVLFFISSPVCTKPFAEITAQRCAEKRKNARESAKDMIKTESQVILGERMAKQKKGTVTGRVLHDPVKDKLREMHPLDLSKC